MITKLIKWRVTESGAESTQCGRRGAVTRSHTVPWRVQIHFACRTTRPRVFSRRQHQNDPPGPVSPRPTHLPNLTPNALWMAESEGFGMFLNLLACLVHRALYSRHGA